MLTAGASRWPVSVVRVADVTKSRTRARSLSLQSHLFFLFAKLGPDVPTLLVTGAYGEAPILLSLGHFRGGAPRALPGAEVSQALRAVRGRGPGSPHPGRKHLLHLCLQQGACPQWGLGPLAILSPAGLFPGSAGRGKEPFLPLLSSVYLCTPQSLHF